MKVRAEKIFWGVFLILAAIFLVVSQLGFFKGISVVRILFAIFFVAVLVKGLVRLNFGEILFPIAFLCILFDEQLHITAITPWTVLVAALLGTIGLQMMFKKRKHNKHYQKFTQSTEGTEKSSEEEGFSRVENGTDGNRIFFKSTFSGAVKYVNSDNFEYASLECSFGAMKVYFDNAIMQGGNATIDVDVSFGAMELYLPKEWNVVNQIETSLSGVEEQNRNQPTGTHTVTLTGQVSFSGVTIIYV